MNFLAKLFSESGEVSYSRVGSFVALVASISWVSYVVIKSHLIPDLTGPTAFTSAQYALGKVNETVQRVMGNGNSEKA